jgi:hypothetical protein
MVIGIIVDVMAREAQAEHASQVDPITSKSEDSNQEN